jgi:hypothetical protein
MKLSKKIKKWTLVKKNKKIIEKKGNPFEKISF